MSVAAVPTEKDSNSEIVMCGSSQGTVTVFRLDEDSESTRSTAWFDPRGLALLSTKLFETFSHAFVS